MNAQAVSAAPSATRYWPNVGLALTIVLSVPLAMIVETLSVVMARNSVGWGELGVLALFAMPLITTWAAIAISLASRPRWLGLTVAAVLLLAPPVLLFGMSNV